MHQIIKINGLEYWLKNVVGQGAYGKVYEAFNQHNQQQVAIKEVDKRKLQFETLSQTRMEIDILNTIQHPKNPNIIEFIGSQETENFFYMIFEYCPISLEQCSTLFKDFIGENIAKCLINQVVNGLKALQNKKIIHRDLKLENIMLKTDKQSWDQLANNKQRTQQDIAEFFSNVTLKIIDFGVSKANDTDELSTTVAGSCYIMAPEIRMNQPYNDKVDIYSLGVIYNILLTGKLPFNPTLEISLDKQEPLVVDENLHLSTQTKKLLQKMLQFNPNNRPTLDQVYKSLKPNISIRPNRLDQPIIVENTIFIQKKLQSKKVNIQVVESPEIASPEIHQIEKMSIEVQQGKLLPSTNSLTNVASNELEIDRNSSEGWNQNQRNEDQQRNHQEYRETEQGNQHLEIVKQNHQSIENTNKLDFSQSHRIDQPTLGEKSIGINQQQAPSDQTHVQMNFQKYQDHVEKNTVEIRNYHRDLDRTNGQFHNSHERFKTKPNRVEQGQYNERNNIQAGKNSPPTQQEKCVFDYQYIHSTVCNEFQLQAKSIDYFCDRLHQILQLVPKFVCQDLWQILGGLTPLASMLEAGYGIRVDQECYLFQYKLKSINEAITKVLHHFHQFSEAYELSKKTSYQQLLEKITGDAIQWIVDNASRSNLQSNNQIQITIERLRQWDEGGSAKSIVENKSSEQPSTDLTLKTAYSKKLKQSNVDIYDPDNIQRLTKEVEKKSQQIDRMNKKSNQYQDVVDKTPVEGLKQYQTRDPYIDQPNTGHRQNDYDFQQNPMNVNEQTQQRNQTKNQFYKKPYRQPYDQIDEEKSQVDNQPTPLQQEKCVYQKHLRKCHHSSACDKFQIQANGIDSFCQRLKDLINYFPEFLHVDLGQILSGLMPLASRLEDEYGSRVDQGCFVYISKLKQMKDIIREFQGSFPKVSKFDQPYKKMTYNKMLEYVTEDAIQLIILNAQRSSLQSNTSFQLRIERLMLWNEGSQSKLVNESKMEQNHLGEPRTDFTLRNSNSSQSNADFNYPSKNISRETNPLDDRCNIKEEIHFCILADQYQTCRILQCIHITLEGYQTIQEFPKDQFRELACIYKQTLTPILEELEGYQRNDIELRSCYRNLFRSMNQLKRGLDKLLEWSKLNPQHLDTRLANWRADPIYFQKFIFGLLNLLSGKLMVNAQRGPIQGTVISLIQLQNLLGHTKPNIRINDDIDYLDAEAFFQIFKQWSQATTLSVNQRPQILNLQMELDPHYSKPPLQQEFQQPFQTEIHSERQKSERLHEGRRIQR